MTYDFYRAPSLGDITYDAVAFSDPFLPGAGHSNALVVRGAAIERLVDLSTCGVPLEQLPNLADHSINDEAISEEAAMYNVADGRVIGFKDIHPCATAAVFFFLRGYGVPFDEIQTSDDLTKGVWQFGPFRPGVAPAFSQDPTERYVDGVALATQALTVAHRVTVGREITEFSVNEDYATPLL